MFCNFRHFLLIASVSLPNDQLAPGDIMQNLSHLFSRPTHFILRHFIHSTSIEFSNIQSYHTWDPLDTHCLGHLDQRHGKIMVHHHLAYNIITAPVHPKPSQGIFWTNRARDLLNQSFKENHFNSARNWSARLRLPHFLWRAADLQYWLFPYAMEHFGSTAVQWSHNMHVFFRH